MTRWTMGVFPVAAALVVALPLQAQQPAAAASDTTVPDTGVVQQLEPVVVTAERAAAPISMSTSAVSVIDGRELNRRPVRTLADAIQQVPGLSMVDFDGQGLDPQAMVRGFYGGGDAEYLVLLVDGRPLTDLESGRINWDRIPISSIKSIEIVRGGASAAWGDAALGGVINVITKQGSRRAIRGALTGGSHGGGRGVVSLADTWRGHDLAVSGNLSRTDGFRSHADRSTGGISGSVAVLQNADRTLSVSTLHDWRSVEDPGPLSGAALEISRSQVAPFYRFDRSTERLHRFGLDGTARLGAHRASGSLTAEYRHTDRVRTLPLAPDFADTKNRVLTTARLLGSAQLEVSRIFVPGADNLLVGFDGSVGRMTSEYYGFLQGDSATYTSASPVRGQLEDHGVGSRAALAGFFRYGLQIAPALSVSVGGRVDWLHDGFEPRAPSDGASESASRIAFSPKLGVSFRYLGSQRHAGHLYANVARSFKAPTPDQLFDQRTVPVPFPPYAITFANAGLRPQYGTNTELGGYHRAVLAPGALTADLTVAVYQLDLRDELDFDLQSFRYANIGRSRHRGLETGLKLEGPHTVGLFANYTLQAATARAGENTGKYLKAIPRHFVTAGVTVGPSSGPAASVVVSGARRIYIDDANTQELPGWTRWDARLSYSLRGVRLSADVFNLLDAKFSTTGFPDPANPSMVYYYPAAGRTLQIGVTRDW
jgi:vitamin B12 transporter